MAITRKQEQDIKATEIVSGKREPNANKRYFFDAEKPYQKKKVREHARLHKLSAEERDYKIKRDRLLLAKRVNRHLTKKTGKEKKEVIIPPKEFTKDFVWPSSSSSSPSPSPEKTTKVSYKPSAPVVYRITLRNAISEIDAFDDIVCERNFHTKTYPIPKADLKKIILACDTLKRDCELLLCNKETGSLVSDEYLSDSSVISPLLSSGPSTDTFESWSSFVSTHDESSMDSFISDHGVEY